MRRVAVDLVLFIAMLLPGCSKQPPMPRGRFVNLYVSLQLINAASGGNDSLQRARADSAMRALGVSDSLLDSTLSWYSAQPERWATVLAEANRRLDSMKAKYLKLPRR